MAGSVTDAGATGRSGGCGTFASRPSPDVDTATGSATGVGVAASSFADDGAGVAQAHRVAGNRQMARRSKRARIIGARLARSTVREDLQSMNSSCINQRSEYPMHAAGQGRNTRADSFGATAQRLP